MKLFLTGAGGFVGKEVRRELLAAGHSVVGLERSAGAVRAPGGDYRAVSGDLLRPGAWAGELEGVDTVVHMAASTGKATRAEHFRSITQGTRYLLAACTSHDIKRIVNVSTIAVKFPDKSRYWYAQAKEQAEQLVRESGLDYATVRPTIVTGPGSPVVEGLARLAGLPVLVMFGAGRARVQPIDVLDLARSLAVLATRPALGRTTVELGGPEVLSIEALLRGIRRALGRANGRVIHVPLGPVLPMLGLLETVAWSAVPLTVGQLATFRFDGVADNGVAAGLPAAEFGVEAMLRRSLA